MRNEILVDTVAWLGLLSPLAPYHRRASRSFAEARQERSSLLTTSLIVAEVLDGAAERDRRFSPLLRRAIERFEVEVVWVDEPLFERAWEFYDARHDKEWSLTDCVSFVLMKQRGLFQSLTYDHHFEQAGFGALLREPKI